MTNKLSELADKLPDNGTVQPAKTRAPKRPAVILIKEQIDKLSNSELKEITEYCLKVKTVRKEKAEAEAKELS